MNPLNLLVFGLNSTAVIFYKHSVDFKSFTQIDIPLNKETK